MNVIITFAKILPLLLFIVLALLAFQFKIFQSNFWRPVTVNYPSLLKQVKNTMLVTVWVFIGIEGASVYSARAKHRSDIGKATLIGFIITLFLLMAVSLLSLGILPQAELAQLKNLSMAGVLEKIIGHWGAIVIADRSTFISNWRIPGVDIIGCGSAFNAGKRWLDAHLFSQGK